HAVQTLLAHHVADAHEVDVLSRNLDGEISLRDLELEVQLGLSADGPGLDLFDQCCTVVRVDNGLPNSESHLQVSPFAEAYLITPEFAQIPCEKGGRTPRDLGRCPSRGPLPWPRGGFLHGLRGRRRTGPEVAVAKGPRWPPPHR